VFGDVTFAQSPFASLGGATYGVDVSESATANSTQSVITSFAGTEAETAAAAATQAALANMFVSQNETALAESDFDTVNNIFNVSQRCIDKLCCCKLVKDQTHLLDKANKVCASDVRICACRRFCNSRKNCSYSTV